MTITPQFLMAIALGGALGALSRFFTQHYVALWLGLTFPWGTLIANVSGCLLIGAISGFWSSHDYVINETLRGLVVIGFLGAFTTFSAFSLDTMVLFQNGEMFRAMGNILLNFMLCLLAVTLGHWLGRSLSI